jgi:radical SAM protein with 4Fe4S-binding SPASM domain
MSIKAKFTTRGDIMYLVLDPKYRMRREEGYVLLYKYDEQSGSVVRTLLDPIRAILIALMDGKRDENDLVDAYAYLTNSSIEESKKVINDLLNQYKEYFVDVTKVTSYITYNPGEFVIDAKDIDLNIKRLRAPVSFLLLLTEKCYTDCIYCYAQRKPIESKQYLKLDRILELLDEAKELGVAQVSLSGGDPMTYPHIFDVLKRIHENGLNVYISTKTYISPDTAIKLKNTGLATMQISIDTVSDDIAFAMVGRENYATNALKSMKNLMDVGIKVRSNCVITSHNALFIEDLLATLVSMNIEKISLTSYGRSMYHHKDSNFLSEEDNKKVIEALGKYTNSTTKITYSGIGERKFNSVEDYRKRSKCTGGTEALVIHPDGNVTLCEEMPKEEAYIVGNVKENTILEIWNSDKIIEHLIPSRDKFKGTACYDCLEFYECHSKLGRCYRDALKSYGTMYAPTPSCPYASESIRLN